MTQETKPHRIYEQDETGAITDNTLAMVHPASPEAVRTVLDAPEGGMDGRSEYVWVRLNNGDLILGVFPHGDTYFDVERDAAYPGD